MLVPLRAVSPSEALALTLDAKYPEHRGEISFEYMGDILCVITVPERLDPDDVRRCAQSVLPLPVDIRVEVKTRC